MSSSQRVFDSSGQIWQYKSHDSRFWVWSLLILKGPIHGTYELFLRFHGLIGPVSVEEVTEFEVFHFSIFSQSNEVILIVHWISCYL